MQAELLDVIIRRSIRVKRRREFLVAETFKDARIVRAQLERLYFARRVFKRRRARRFDKRVLRAAKSGRRADDLWRRARRRDGRLYPTGNGQNFATLERFDAKRSTLCWIASPALGFVRRETREKTRKKTGLLVEFLLRHFTFPCMG